jgi:16S rRNA (cytosine967-C5)-methyltransferase
VQLLARRLGHTIIEPRRWSKDKGVGEPENSFDAALVDVPCSNTGVLGRRPEVRWRLRPDDLPRLLTLQVQLLRQAARYVKPSGTVVYSTCSIEPEENQEVVRQTLDVLELVAEEEAVPGRPGDGGYWARLRRRQGPDS